MMEAVALSVTKDAIGRLSKQRLFISSLRFPVITTYPRFKFEQTWMHLGVEFLKSATPIDWLCVRV